MKLIENMNYRQWQKRNTDLFLSLNKQQKEKTRQKGYYNVGWEKVQKSWLIISQIKDSKIVSLFDKKIEKGDLIGAIDMSIMESDKSSKKAKKALEKLKNNEEKVTKIVQRNLAKYKR